MAVLNIFPNLRALGIFLVLVVDNTPIFYGETGKWERVSDIRRST